MPDEAISFSRVAFAAYDQKLVPSGVEAGLDFNGTYTLPGSPHSFGAHAVVVEVGRDTGEVKFLRYVGYTTVAALSTPC